MRCKRCGAENLSGSRFCSACGAPADAVFTLATDDEQRQVTVVFCDLVGSTELLRRLDTEDYQVIISWYHEICARAITANGGHVNQLHGDGVVAEFGHARSREDDAHRAVRCGLAVLESLQRESLRFDHLGIRPMARIGIHTGRILVHGRVDDSRLEPSAVGLAINLASRIQTEAEPGSLLVSEVTWAIVRRRFAGEDLGHRKLKGLDEAMRLWRVSGESKGASDPSGWIGASEFVGRADELHLLAEEWNLAKEGSTRFVLVRGEPGIGKSRLINRFVEGLAGRTRVLVLQAREADQATPFRPVIDLLSDELNLGPLDDPARRARRLREAVSELGFQDLDEVAYLGRLVAGSADGASSQPDAAVGAERQGAIGLLIRLLTAVATREPTVLLVSDLHWADPSTVQLLGTLVNTPLAVPLLGVLSARSEFAPDWARPDRVATVELGPLDRAETEALVRAVAGGKALPADLTRQIDRQSGRVPLFVQELTRIVIDSGSVREREASWEVAGPLVVDAVPPTVDAVLTSRIDGLGQARPTALLAATIGRNFSFDLLAEVSTRSREELARDVDEMVRAGIATETDQTGRQYTFSHALLQDAAYGVLLRSTRERYHSAIAMVLLRDGGDPAAQRPELIARHLSLAGRHDEAVGYWEAAARRASAQACYAEATESLRQALSSLMALDAGPERDARELPIQSSLGPLCSTIYGWGSVDAEKAWARALLLAERLGRSLELCGLLWGSWSVQFIRGELEQAQAGAARLQQVVLDTASFLAPIGHAAMALTLAYRGQFGPLLAEADAGLAGCSVEADRQFIESLSLAPSVGLRACKAVALWMAGQIDEADNVMTEMLVAARGLDHGPSLASALVYTLMGGCFRSSYGGDLRYLLPISDELSVLCEDFYFWDAANLACRGVIFQSLGDPETARRCMLEGLESYDQTGARLGFVLMAAFCAEAFSRMGDDAEATRLLAAAGHDVSARNEGLFAPDVWRLRGAIAARAGDLAAAEALYREAIVMARAQNARPLELRAALDLHDLIGAAEEVAAAVDRLTPATALPEIDRALTIVGGLSPSV